VSGARTTIAIAAAVCVVAAAACADGGDAPTTQPAPTYRLDDTLRLDQVQVLGSHNSYHARPHPEVLTALRNVSPALGDTIDYEHAPLPEQFDVGVRQVELDVLSDPDGGKFAAPGLPMALGADVRSDPVMHEPGFKVLHHADVDTNSTCLTFVACLQLVEEWSDDHPGHVPISVLVEMKDAAVDETMFAALESEILTVFPPERLITPDFVRGDAPTLGAAVQTRGWPVLGSVRGRVLFALDNTTLRDAYLLGHPSLTDRLLFTASTPGADDAAFAKLNDPVVDARAIAAALAANMIVRTRADADTVQARTNDTSRRDTALDGGAQLVSTDYERADPGLATGYVVVIPGGTPARCNPVTAPPGCRAEDVEDPELLRASP
jgi:hypothetical protein